MKKVNLLENTFYPIAEQKIKIKNKANNSTTFSKKSKEFFDS